MSHVNKEMASFFLTTKCNLRCVYCYNCEERQDKDEQTLSFRIAKAGVDYYFDNFSSRHIRFYGPGEPTQEFELMKKIVDYAKSRSKEKIKVELQTNGAFSEYVCKYVYDNINIVWVSMDGTPDIQNNNRPFASGVGSASVVERNIKYLSARENDENNVVGIRVTITNETLNRQKEMIDYFSSLGVKYIWNDPVFPEVGECPYCEDILRKKTFSFDYELYVRTYIEAYKYAREKGIFYGSFLTINFDGKSIYHCRACIPVPHFTTDGFVSACDLVTFGAAPKHMDCFVYGKWNEEKEEFEFDQNKIHLLRNRNTNNMNACKICEVSNYCGGYCLGEVANETGSYMKNKAGVCKAIKQLFKELGPTKLPYPYFHP